MNYKLISTNLDDESSDFIDERPKQTEEGDDAEENFELPIKQVEQKLLSLDQLKLSKKDNVILVLGSEGEGVSRTIARMADYKVVIPPKLAMN